MRVAIANPRGKSSHGRELEFGPLVHGAVRTAMRGGCLVHPDERAALLALVIRVADGADTGPLVHGTLRASVGAGVAAALHESRALLALVVVHICFAWGFAWLLCVRSRGT